jgi:cytosolic carboxypeptidase protein 2/3
LRSKKKIVLVMARQHPSEVVSSFVMEGFVNYLVQLQGG